MYRYKIGNIQFLWSNEFYTLQEDEYTSCFYSDDNDVAEEIVYKCHMVNPQFDNSFILLDKNGTYELYDTEKGILIVYHWAQCRYGFWYWIDDLFRDNTIRCYFNPDILNQIPLNAVRFFSCAGMHSKLLQRGALIFHASYIDWKGQAILFAAPSGTGKSTQANLWKRFQEVQIVNDDRALIKKRGDRWYSFGYPCCGSSNICINKTLPLRTIVVLEQGEDNKVIALSISEKIRALISGAEFFIWDKREQDLAFELAGLIVEQVSIVKLICRPDQQAVEVLKQYLENENGKNIGLSLSESFDK